MNSNSEILRRVQTCTLALVAEQLPRRDIGDLNDELKTLLADPIVAVGGAVSLPVERPEDFFSQVSIRTGLPYAQAMELCQGVCSDLGGRLSAGLRLRLERHLPRWLFDLLSFEQAPAIRPDQREVVGSAERSSTLATGRPGSRHPLSEARPERAQAHSIARSDEPHGDTKLSSSAGTTQEREGSTLATARK